MFFSWEHSVFYPCHQVCSLSDCQRSFFLKHFHSINDRTLALNCGPVKILSKLTETYSKEVWFKNKALVCHKVSGSIPGKSVLGICMWIDVECESRWALLIIKSREEWEPADGATWWYPDQSESGALQLVIRYFTRFTQPNNHKSTQPNNKTKTWLAKPFKWGQTIWLNQRALQLVIRYFTILQTSTDPNIHRSTQSNIKTTTKSRDSSRKRSNGKYYSIIHDYGKIV